MHYNFINLKLVKQNIGEQRKVNKCRTKSGKKLCIGLCNVVKYINGKQVIYLYRIVCAVKLKYISFKRTAQ